MNLSSWSIPEITKYLQLGFLGFLGVVVLWFRGRRPSSQFKDPTDRKSPPRAPRPPSAENLIKEKPTVPLSLSGFVASGEPHILLGVSVDADEAAIRKAYRELMKHYHPDAVARPGTQAWQDAQVIAEQINAAKDKMIARHRSG